MGHLKFPDLVGVVHRAVAGGKVRRVAGIADRDKVHGHVTESRDGEGDAGHHGFLGNIAESSGADQSSELKSFHESNAVGNSSGDSDQDKVNCE